MCLKRRVYENPPRCPSHLETRVSTRSLPQHILSNWSNQLTSVKIVIIIGLTTILSMSQTVHSSLRHQTTIYMKMRSNRGSQLSVKWMRRSGSDLPILVSHYKLSVIVPFWRENRLQWWWCIKRALEKEKNRERISHLGRWLIRRKPEILSWNTIRSWLRGPAGQTGDLQRSPLWVARSKFDGHRR